MRFSSIFLFRTPTQQRDVLQDALKLSILSTASSPFTTILKKYLDRGDRDYFYAPEDNITSVLTGFMKYLNTWDAAQLPPSANPALALALYQVCETRACPVSVRIAAATALVEHNSENVLKPWPEGPSRYGPGSVAPNLPAIKAVDETVSALQAHALNVFNFNLKQQRTCFVHGCIQANDEDLVKFEIQDTGAPLHSGYETISSKEVVSTYDSDSSTFHWLWRLQSDSEGKGVAWDLATVGPRTLRVYVITRQEYEVQWLALCWFGFILRLLTFIVFDAIAACMETKCECNGEEVSVQYLECFASRHTWVALACLCLLDYINIFFPLYNPTAVQQGQMAWASKNEDMSSLLGYTACKLELALLPAIICAAGPLMLGDHDTDMETFLFQLAVFMMPVVMAKLGYGFEVNTSSLLLLVQALAVAIRFMYRYKTESHSTLLKIHGQDETLKSFEDGPTVPVRLALGERLVNMECKIDNFHEWKSYFANTMSEEDASPFPIVESSEATDRLPLEESSADAASDSVASSEPDLDIQIERLFLRYDLDGSGTINSWEELEQLCYNLGFRLKLDLNPVQLDEIVNVVKANHDEIDWDLSTFSVWFKQEFKLY